MSNVLAWVAAGLGVLLMVLLLLSFMADARQAPTSEVAGSNSSRVAYLQFGVTADLLVLADPAAPDEHQTLATIPHAPEYGILPTLSPSGERFAYTALPEAIPAPGPDSPAQLWVAGFDSTPPTLLAEDIDLLVPPVWSPDGSSVVYRRSEGLAHTLAMGPVSGGEERIVSYSETEALFPVGFVDGGARLLVVGLNQDEGSRLYKVELSSGVQTEVARLSPGLTRDWALSPDASRLAFLEIAFSDTAMTSRAAVVELSSGAVTPVTSSTEAAFSPIWTSAGRLAVGVFNPKTSDASLLVIDGESRSTIAGPSSGFDLPLAYDAAKDAYVVTRFENDSIASPGRSTLVVVGADGERTTLVEGEVTLVGWTHP